MYLETALTKHKEVISHLSVVVVEQEQNDERGGQRRRPKGRRRRRRRRVVPPSELGLQLVVEEVVELLHLLLVDPLGERLIGRVLKKNAKGNLTSTLITVISAGRAKIFNLAASGAVSSRKMRQALKIPCGKID